MNTTTVDLAQQPTIRPYYGKKAVWTSYEGRRRIGTLTPDPRGGAWPVTAFPDGTHGRNGSVIELVDDSAPRTATATVHGGHGTGYVVSSPDLDAEQLAALTDALDAFGIGSPTVGRYMRAFHHTAITLVEG